ncbi:MAG: hypothetical protein NTY88_06725 [Bacteroidetes bacterium]|nr:hypothetical protein [Bacteroidota bacterium]
MKISIPKPCHENWSDMTPENRGAFCKVCSKAVVDFSNMSDEEVIRYFENKKQEKTCGRFRLSQLSPYELKINLREVAAHRSFPKIFAAAFFIIFSSMFICKSDTGDPMQLHIVATDVMDTASLILKTDTTSIEKKDSIEPQQIMMGGAVSVTEVKPVYEMLTGDTIINPAVTKDTVVSYPMMMGKVACTRPQKTDEEIKKVEKTKQTEKKTKGEVRLMGDLIY